MGSDPEESLLATADTAATPPHRQGLPNGHQIGNSPLHAGSSESIGQTVNVTPSACTITSENRGQTLRDPGGGDGCEVFGE